jgi:hypothetical protein
VKGEAAAPATAVRTAARNLLGRDSESLSERNFLRILHDAHDGDIVDLRRRGSDYEVAAAVAAAPVDRQLEAAATANAPAPKPVAPMQRGMGARGIGRGPMGGKGEMPAHLLNLGVVGTKPAAAAVVPATTAAAAPSSEPLVLSIEEPKSAASKKPAKKRAGTAKKAKTPASEPASAAAKRPARGARKKTAAKTAATSGSES